MADIITTDIGEFKLGCNVPTSFPTRAKTYADIVDKMLTVDQVKTELQKNPTKDGFWNRRKRYAGSKFIRNQGPYGACNGFSTAAGLSRHRELRGEPYVCLSGADAYSQMNGGQDNGSTLSDGMIVFENGIAPESLVPYNQIYTSQISSEAKAARARFAGTVAYPIDSEDEMATACILGRLIIVAVNANNAFMNEDGDGLNQGSNGVGNHSTLVQDVRLGRDGNIWYDMANSWDVSYCQGGYTWLSFSKHLRQTIQNHRFWVIVDSKDDTGDNSSPPVAD